VELSPERAHVHLKKGRNCYVHDSGQAEVRDTIFEISALPAKAGLASNGLDAKVGDTHRPVKQGSFFGGSKKGKWVLWSGSHGEFTCLVLKSAYVTAILTKETFQADRISSSSKGNQKSNIAAKSHLGQVKGE